jgi:putative MATE family efflux protein
VAALAAEQIGPMVGRLAWPVVAEQMLQSLVGVVDVALVGRLSAAAVAGVGTGTQLLQVAISAMGAVAVGTTVLVALATGARREREAAHVTRQSLLAGVAMGLLLALAGWTLAHALIAALGPEPAVVEQGALFLHLSSLGAVPLVVMLVAGGALRGAGDSRSPLYASMAMNVVNLIVAYVLIFGAFGLPAMGVAGSALGGVAGRLVGAALLLLFLRRRRILGAATGRWSVDLGVIRRVLGIGIPTAIEQTMLSLGFLLYGAMVISLGTAVYATQRITFQAINLAYMPGFGFATAATTLTGQSLGAGRPDLVETATRAALRQALFWMTLAGVLFAVLADPVMRAFSSDPEVIALGRIALPVLCLAQPFWAIGQVYAGTLRGAGDARFPMVATSVGMWGVRLPLAYLLGIVLGFGLPGVYFTSMLDSGLRAFLNWRRFRSGKWRTRLRPRPATSAVAE